MTRSVGDMYGLYANAVTFYIRDAQVLHLKGVVEPVHSRIPRCVTLYHKVCVGCGVHAGIYGVSCRFCLFGEPY